MAHEAIKLLMQALRPPEEEIVDQRQDMYEAIDSIYKDMEKLQSLNDALKMCSAGICLMMTERTHMTDKIIGIFAIAMRSFGSCDLSASWPTIRNSALNAFADECALKMAIIYGDDWRSKVKPAPGVKQ